MSTVAQAGREKVNVLCQGEENPNPTFVLKAF